MRIVFLFLLALILAAAMLPSIATAVNDTLRATNCDSLGFVPSLCGTMAEYSRKAGWSVDEEKRYLLNIFAEGGIMPKHEFIKYWNSKLVFGNEAPDNDAMDYLKCSDNNAVNCIADAWIRTFSVMPSFIENNTFYIKESGDVQVGYYYELNAPPAIGYPKNGEGCFCGDPYENEYGDCRTDFYYTDKSKVKVKMNGNEFYNEKAAEYGENLVLPFPSPASETNTFRAIMQVYNQIHRNHYQWHSAGTCSDVCCESCDCEEGPCGCCEYADRYRCVYENTELVPEIITLRHSFDGEIKRFEKPSVSHEIVVEDVQSTPRGVIATNARDYKLFMDKAKLHKAGSRYNMTYLYEPYNILSLVRVPAESYFVNDLHIEETGNSTVNFKTYAYNMEEEECSFVKLWPFDYDAESCNIFKKATTSLDIETGKRHYKLDEGINLRVDFESDDDNENAEIRITYGDETRSVSVHSSDTVELEPKEGYLTIYAEFEGDDSRSAAEAIPVPVYASDDTYATYLGIAMIFLVVYGMGYFARRYMPQ